MAPDELGQVLDQERVLLERAHGRMRDEELERPSVGLERPRDVRVHADDEREGLERAGTLREHSGDLAENIPDGLEDGVRGEGPGEGEELREGQRAWGLLRVLFYETRELARGD